VRRIGRFVVLTKVALCLRYDTPGHKKHKS
jgi:hypothetical protein